MSWFTFAATAWLSFVLGFFTAACMAVSRRADENAESQARALHPSLTQKEEDHEHVA